MRIFILPPNNALLTSKSRSKYRGVGDRDCMSVCMDESMYSIVLNCVLHYSTEHFNTVQYSTVQLSHAEDITVKYIAIEYIAGFVLVLCRILK